VRRYSGDPLRSGTAKIFSSNFSIFCRFRLGGNLEGKKIAYLFYDNPSGHEPLLILQCDAYGCAGVHRAR
jgi:hypothetical protein